MSRGKYIYLILLLIISVGLVLGMKNAYHFDEHAYAAQRGQLNLSDWQNDIVKVRGEWLFTPNTTALEDVETGHAVAVEVPHFWESSKIMGYSAEGEGIYTVSISGLKPNEDYGVYVLDEVTSYQLYANKHLIAENGNVSTKTPDWKPVTSVFSTDAKGNVLFEMVIANAAYNRGGFWNPIIIGDVKSIIDYHDLKLMHNVFFISAITVMGIFFLGLFLSHHQKKTTLFFSILCFDMGLRLLLTDQRIITSLIPNLNWWTRIQLEYVTGYLILPLFGLFVIHLIRLKYHKLLFGALIGLALMSLCIPLILPINVYISFLSAYRYVGLLTVILTLFVLVKMAYHNQAGLMYFITALVAIILAMIKEIYFQDEISYVPIGIFVMTIAFSLMTIEEFVTIAKRNQVLASEVVTDKLTGVYNRSYLQTYLYQIGESGTRPDAFMIFLDLDRFKNINDLYGHAIGDEVLKIVSSRLKKTLRNEDFIARYGGDEFVILIEHRTEREVEKIAERIITAINLAMTIGDHNYYVGASIGFSEYTKGIKIDEWLKNSDAAMYEAKKNGGNRFVAHKHQNTPT